MVSTSTVLPFHQHCLSFGNGLSAVYSVCVSFSKWDRESDELYQMVHISEGCPQYHQQWSVRARQFLFQLFESFQNRAKIAIYEDRARHGTAPSNTFLPILSVLNTMREQGAATVFCVAKLPGYSPKTRVSYIPCKSGVGVESPIARHAFIPKASESCFIPA